MQIDRQRFRDILLELVEENAYACSGILSLVRIRFTDSVPTLAVTLHDPPELRVNLGFLRKHAECETDVKAVLLHEFLHILLNHTERFKTMTPALNLALDAVINNIIANQFGDDYAAFFKRFYKDARGVFKLLVPLDQTEYKAMPPRESSSPVTDLRRELGRGTVLADDIMDVLREIERTSRRFILPKDLMYLGNHDPQAVEDGWSEETRWNMEWTLRSLNGDGLFRDQRRRGMLDPLRDSIVRGTSTPHAAWEKAAWKLLRDFATPDSRTDAAQKDVPASSALPVLHEGDRRGFLRYQWSPLMPEITWPSVRQGPAGTCQVYLDISGSMNGELDELVALLNRLRRHLRMPFWAFSDSVEPAVIEDGSLVTRGSGGTSIECVLSHIHATKPGKALVISDGFVQECDYRQIQALEREGQRIFALVSRKGTTHHFETAGIPCAQLERYPEGRP